MHVYAVTIGRNAPVTDPSLPQYDDVTGERIAAPMSDERWEQFIEDVKADMLHAIPLADLAEIHRGTGFWDGVEEESAKLTLLCHSEATADMVAELRSYLSELARLYSQDAIALTIGQSELC